MYDKVEVVQAYRTTDGAVFDNVAIAEDHQRGLDFESGYGDFCDTLYAETLSCSAHEVRAWLDSNKGFVLNYYGVKCDE